MRRAVLVPVVFSLAPLVGYGTPGPLPLSAQEVDLEGRWTLALELGELPFHGSFKLGVSAGYQANELAWFGLSCQIADRIRRDGSWFNAGSTRLDGLVRSEERVGQRAYLQTRLRPTRWSPYLSVGIVFNDRDTETMLFDDRPRRADGHPSTGALRLTVSRGPGVRPALGVGWAWTSSRGVTAFVEWAGWWLRGAPDPQIDIDADGASEGFRLAVESRLREHFTSSLFNSYHVFQLGVGISR